MKTVLVMRHAKSDWGNPDLADFDRPLNTRGERDAPRMGTLLKEEDRRPDMIMASAARRAQQTAEAVAAAIEYPGQIEARAALYGSGAVSYLEAIRGLPDEVGRVLVVGHNPSVEELVGVLTGTAVTMPTATVVQVDLPIRRWREVGQGARGSVVGVWRPKELG